MNKVLKKLTINIDVNLRAISCEGCLPKTVKRDLLSQTV